MEPGGDPRALGGAVTMRLCGSWEHDGPCPVAPHYTDTHTDDTLVMVRVLFAAEPSREADARRAVREALAMGELVGPDGVLTRWELESDGPGTLTDAERARTERLASG